MICIDSYCQGKAGDDHIAGDSQDQEGEGIMLDAMVSSINYYSIQAEFMLSMTNLVEVGGAQ